MSRPPRLASFFFSSVAMLSPPPPSQTIPSCTLHCTATVPALVPPGSCAERPTNTCRCPEDTICGGAEYKEANRQIHLTWGGDGGQRREREREKEHTEWVGASRTGRAPTHGAHQPLRAAAMMVGWVNDGCAPLVEWSKGRKAFCSRSRRGGHRSSFLACCRLPPPPSAPHCRLVTSPDSSGRHVRLTATARDDA